MNGESYEEHYLLTIYKAYQSIQIDPTELAKSLVKNICEIYRFLEPEHFFGELVIYQTFDDQDLFQEKVKDTYFDKNFLINNCADQLIIQVTNKGIQYVMANKEVFDDLKQCEHALFYHYCNHEEYFYANKTQIDIPKQYYCASSFATQYHDLYTALEDYKTNEARYTSCPILSDVWHDDNRIFFRGGGKDLPEKYMQISLVTFLRSRIRGIHASVREHNLGASKPVDIWLHWQQANRTAIIEIKWLGKACDETGKQTNEYSPSRVRDGCIQLKEYLDLERRDTPRFITKGYLVVYNGRRQNMKEHMTSISCSDGKHYINEDFSSYFSSFVSSNYNFEKPFIMFCEPICV